MAYPFVQAFYDYGPRKGPVLGFVVHMAEGGGTVGYLAKANPNRVSVHYVIERTGRTVRMLREDHASGSIRPTAIRTSDDADGFYGATAAKAVMGSWWKDPNSAVISLEIEGFAKDGPNADQRRSLGLLVSDVRSRFPSIGLLGHRDFADYKACPGKLIPWTALGGHGPASEDEVKPFAVFEDPHEVLLKPDASGDVWLYDNSALQPSAGNIELTPNRPLRHAGTFDGFMAVAYEPTAVDSNVSSKAYFVEGTKPGEGQIASITRVLQPVPDCTEPAKVAANAAVDKIRDGFPALLQSARPA